MMRLPEGAVGRSLTARGCYIFNGMVKPVLTRLERPFGLGVPSWVDNSNISLASRAAEYAIDIRAFQRGNLFKYSRMHAGNTRRDDRLASWALQSVIPGVYVFVK